MSKISPAKRRKNANAKIRYSILRDLGYSVAEARKLRYKSDIPTKGVKLSPKTGKVEKKNIYKRLRHTADVDKTIAELREVDTSHLVYTQHGSLSHNSLPRSVLRAEKNRYNALSHKIRKMNYTEIIDETTGKRRRVNITDKQAWYMLWLMIEGKTKPKYDEVKEQLATDPRAERYKPKGRLSSKK